MQTITLYANRSAQLRRDYPSQNFSSLGLVNVDSDIGDLLLGFEAFPQELRFNKISSIKFYLYGYAPEDLGQPNLGYPNDPVDFQTITYTTRGTHQTVYYQALLFRIAEAYKSRPTDIVFLRHAINNAIKLIGQFSPLYVEASHGTNKPYFEVTVYDASVVPILASVSPSSGFVPKYQASIFSWTLASDNDATYASFAEPDQASAVFRWRAGSTGAVHSISVAGNTKSCTVPANTFDADDIQWQVAVTLDSGDTLTSDWSTISTAEPLSSATAVAPSNVVLSSSDNIEFKWSHVISTGTMPTGFELQTSTNGTTWAPLVTNTASQATTYTMAGGTFSAGDIWWRVRTYNTDGEPGSWANAEKFTMIAPPPTPVVSFTDTGLRPAIRWETAGQQAYEVTYTGGPGPEMYFGAQQNWKSPVYLPGAVSISVRVQNKYGLWSAASTVSRGALAPGAVIPLTLSGGEVISLNWTPATNYPVYIVYRDGVPIAKVSGTTYTDHFCLGSHQYKVLGVDQTGTSYGESAAVTGSATVQVPMISPREDPEWLQMPLSEVQHREVNTNVSRQTTYLQMSGYKYPIAERSEHQEHSISLSAAFPLVQWAAEGAETGATLEAMVGQVVALKTPQDGMITAVLDALGWVTNDFYKVYTMRLRQIHWEEAVSLDP